MWTLGVTRGFGSRRHYCFCDPAFLELREGLEAEVDEHLTLAVEAAAGHEHELLQELRTQLQDEESFHEVEELFNENKREEAILLYARINYGASYSEDFQPSTLPASHGEEPNGSAVEASHGEESKVSVAAASPGEESHDASTLDVDDVISGILRDSDQRQRTSVITSVIAAVLASSTCSAISSIFHSSVVHCMHCSHSARPRPLRR